MKITFDGTSASGKGSIASAVAARYGFAYLDTGKLYRLVALIIYNEKLQDCFLDKLDDIKGVLFSKGGKYNISLGISEHLLFDLYLEHISKLASKIAKEQSIRDLLFDYQRDFVTKNSQGVVLDGRDTGSVICPEADKKFYIDADVKVRAHRRYLQMKNKEGVSEKEIEESLRKRDEQDKNREIAPLIVAEGAAEIDNSKNSLEDTVQKIVALIDS